MNPIAIYGWEDFKYTPVTEVWRKRVVFRQGKLLLAGLTNQRNELVNIQFRISICILHESVCCCKNYTHID